MGKGCKKSGGYDEQKQFKWCSGVLQRASELATDMFGNASDIVLARYSAIDCGYEGVKRLFIKRYGLKTLRTLLAEFVCRNAKSTVFKTKYHRFKKCIELTNFNTDNLQ